MSDGGFCAADMGQKMNRNMDNIIVMVNGGIHENKMDLWFLLMCLPIIYYLPFFGMCHVLLRCTFLAYDILCSFLRFMAYAMLHCVVLFSIGHSLFFRTLFGICHVLLRCSFFTHDIRCSFVRFSHMPCFIALYFLSYDIFYSFADSSGYGRIIHSVEMDAFHIICQEIDNLA